MYIARFGKQEKAGKSGNNAVHGHRARELRILFVEGERVMKMGGDGR